MKHVLSSPKRYQVAYLHEIWGSSIQFRLAHELFPPSALLDVLTLMYITLEGTKIALVLLPRHLYNLPKRAYYSDGDQKEDKVSFQSLNLLPVSVNRLDRRWERSRTMATFIFQIWQNAYLNNSFDVWYPLILRPFPPASIERNEAWSGLWKSDVASGVIKYANQNDRLQLNIREIQRWKTLAMN